MLKLKYYFDNIDMVHAMLNSRQESCGQYNPQRERNFIEKNNIISSWHRQVVLCSKVNLNSMILNQIRERKVKVTEDNP